MKTRALRNTLVAAMTVLVSVGVAMAQEYDRILIPVSPQALPGAYGSYWTSSILVRNDSDRFFQTDQFPDLPCQLATCPIPNSQALSTGFVIVGHAGWKDGGFVYVEKPGLDFLSFHLRVWDLSRQSRMWGTEFPVVRESDTFTGPFTLLEIPTDTRFRTLLRIYEFDGVDETRVRLRVYPLFENTLLAEKEINLRVFAGEPYDVSQTFPRYPASERVDLVREFPQVLAFNDLRVVIEPATEGARLWAFVSVVNNETQHVTVITPEK